MAVSVVKICNMALSNIGARSTIESLDEASTEAKQCKLWYDFARQQTLQALDWSFARKRQTLALHSEDADLIDWTFRYQLPADSLIIRKLTNPNGLKSDAVPFRIELASNGVEQTLLTNLEDAEAVYTFDQGLVNVFSPMFTQALSFLIAHYIAYPLVARMDVKQAMLQAYMMMLRAAMASDANEQVEDAPRDAEWVRGR